MKCVLAAIMAAILEPVFFVVEFSSYNFLDPKNIVFDKLNQQ